MNYVRKKRPIHISKTITSDITSEEFLQVGNMKLGNLFWVIFLGMLGLLYFIK